MSVLPRIALRVGVATDYLREIITGVLDYARGTNRLWAERPWHRRLTGTPLPDGCDGVIVSWQNYDDIEQALQRHIRVVCVTSAKPSEPVPRVIPDNVEIGRTACRYLLSKGFKSLAYVGSGGVHWSHQREMGFAEAAAQAGVDCWTRPSLHIDTGPELAEWLQGHGRSRFLLTAPPLRLTGAVGSPVTPIATV